MRVVSLLPSTTEIMYALGLEEQLVGVTFECNEPPRARVDKRIVVGGKDTSGMSPAAIDTYVREQVAAGEDLYTLRADALAELAPDVILTQDLCRVCALPSEDVESALDYLGCRADVISLDPHTLEDVLASILTVGQHTGASVQAEEMVASLRERLETVARTVAGRPSRTVAIIEWIEPPFTAGHWVPDLVAAAGGMALNAQPGARSTSTTWEAIAAEQPDIVLIAPCGFHLDSACEQATAIASHFPSSEVWAIDADAFVVRPGPRLVDGVEAIAWMLHPDEVPAPSAGRIARVV